MKSRQKRKFPVRIRGLLSPPTRLLTLDGWRREDAIQRLLLLLLASIPRVVEMLDGRSTAVCRSYSIVQHLSHPSTLSAFIPPSWIICRQQAPRTSCRRQMGRMLRRIRVSTDNIILITTIIIIRNLFRPPGGHNPLLLCNTPFTYIQQGGY